MDYRKCQIEAIDCVIDRRDKGENETNLSLCTGAGKSIIIQKITNKNEKIIIVFPWLQLMEQYYNCYNSYESCKIVRYLATEGTLKGVEKLSDSMKELKESSYVIFTTYTSAPLIYKKINRDCKIDLIVHDEAHRIERDHYNSALSSIVSNVGHIVNLSATLPLTKEPHYKYSLLRGIHQHEDETDKHWVVRDFHMELFMCTLKERNETELIKTFVRKLLTMHKQVKLLIYTSEANTDGEESSSVKTFMEKHSKKLIELGYWIKGIKADTKDRSKILRDFEKSRDISILVSCKTLSEGIDLKGANCMLPWDPSNSVVENIQRTLGKKPQRCNERILSYFEKRRTCSDL